MSSNAIAASGLHISGVTMWQDWASAQGGAQIGHPPVAKDVQRCQFLIEVANDLYEPSMDDHDTKLVWSQVSPSGRLSLPAEFRKALGLERGGKVLVELAGNEIRLRTVHEAVSRVQASAKRVFAGKPQISSDDFLAHRRLDWGEE